MIIMNLLNCLSQNMMYMTQSVYFKADSVTC